MNDLLSNFPLYWRWTSSSHSVLPDLVLSQIFPLDNGVLLGCKAIAGSDLKISSTHYFENVSKTRTWLESLSVSEQSVSVVWDFETGVSLPWSVFCKYWDDFCYTSSDDIDVINSINSLFLQWRHDGRFDFYSEAL